MIPSSPLIPQIQEQKQLESPPQNYTNLLHMSTILTQNLVTETTTVLKLKLAPPPPPPPSSTSDLYREQAIDDHLQAEVGFGNWGFIRTASHESVNREKSSHTHPLLRNSSFSRLSAKSLQLCTENLGSETGTDAISPSSIAISFCPSDSCEYSSTHNHKSSQLLQKPKQETKSFPPPPLTTMSGPGSLKVRRRREGGRLIIEAVGRRRCWEAERSGGRLRLCLLTGSDESEATTTLSGGEEVAAEEPRSEGEEFNGEMNMEMGIEKVEMMSRCKELCSTWEPALWVATL
ncbi:protein FANTASTIC FOUR 4 [Sesamum angolense]|uniref:Protein FANTASTIC FOUR 4 n=1 Tax=Sesamum angolense TaxID=2727404 RepID=A0AAE1W844_9LAMI|nr:protein FANTASTIC FOUR 4 [Sesamum angolense]